MELNTFIHFPNSETIDKIYKEEYYSKEKPNYLNEYTEDIDWWKTIYKSRLDKLSLECKNYNLNLNLVDIGSGPGRFVESAQNLGWKARRY